MASETGSGKGPLFPMQVIQPYPTMSNLSKKIALISHKYKIQAIDKGPVYDM